jgi:hypothetical protein
MFAGYVSVAQLESEDAVEGLVEGRNNFNSCVLRLRSKRAKIHGKKVGPLILPYPPKKTQFVVRKISLHVT